MKFNFSILDYFNLQIQYFKNYKSSQDPVQNCQPLQCNLKSQ